MNSQNNKELDRLRQLSVFGEIGWWEVDFTTQEILCSEYVCQLVGIENNRISLQEFLQWVQEDYRSQIACEFMSIEHSEVYELTFPIYNFCGKLYWIYLSVGERKKDENGHLIVFGILKKISAPEEKQEFTAMNRINKLIYQLEDNKTLFKDIFDNIPAGIEIYDADAKLIDINRKDMEIFGVERKEDIVGIDLLHNPNFPPAFSKEIERKEIVDSRIDYHFSRIANYYRSNRKNDIINLYTKIGKLHNSRKECTGYVMMNIDDTERMDSLKRIHEFDKLFLLIADFAKVGYATVNLYDNSGYAIKQWFKNLGEDENTPLENVLGIYAKMHPDDRSRMQLFLEEVRQGKATSFKSDMRIKHPQKANEWNWIQTNLLVVEYAPENKHIGLISINYDITHIKETEAKLIVAKEKAETADRLKNAFLANMSHEIRTPLNAIIGFSSLLVETEDRKEREEFMNIIQTNNDLLLKLISDVLDLAKIEAGTVDFTFKEFELNALCKEIKYSMQRRLDNSNVKIVVDNEENGECWLVSDRGRISQVISNFVNNAIKFTSEGSIHIGFEQLSDIELRIYVEDTGIGIAPEKQEQVFERFVKLNSFVPGTGLGLSICKSIVEQLGGTIGVRSEQGKGSCFWFTLKLTNEELC